MLEFKLFIQSFNIIDNNLQMKALNVVLIILAMTYITMQVHNLYDLSKLSEQDLDEDGLVEVEQSSNNRTESANIISNYYVIRSIHKQKRQAYTKMQSLFKNAVKILIKNRVIPAEDSLVKSRIKPQYLSKKRSWSFSTIFVIFGNEKELQKCYKEFSRLRIQRLSTKPSINFLNEKVVALEVFNNAKQKLAKQLERFPAFQILQVVEIEIKGSQVENSDILQDQLQDEFNQSQQVINEEEIETGSIETDKPPLEMKIVFKLGRFDEEFASTEENNEQATEEEEDQSNQSEESL